MALHIEGNGSQSQVDLNLQARIEEWGEVPVHFRALHLGGLVGDDHFAQRLLDGRLLVYTDPSVQDPFDREGAVLLNVEESAVVVTDAEHFYRLVRKKQGYLNSV